MHTRRRNIEVEFCIDVRSTHSTASDIVHIMRPPDCLDHTGISSMAGGSDRSCVNSALPVHADVLGKLSAGCRRISFCEAGVVVAVISAVALSSCVAMIGRQPGACGPCQWLSTTSQSNSDRRHHRGCHRRKRLQAPRLHQAPQLSCARAQKYRQRAWQSTRGPS